MGICRFSCGDDSHSCLVCGSRSGRCVKGGIRHARRRCCRVGVSGAADCRTLLRCQSRAAKNPFLKARYSVDWVHSDLFCRLGDLLFGHCHAVGHFADDSSAVRSIAAFCPRPPKPACRCMCVGVHHVPLDFCHSEFYDVGEKIGTRNSIASHFPMQKV